MQSFVAHVRDSDRIRCSRSETGMTTAIFSNHESCSSDFLHMSEAKARELCGALTSVLPAAENADLVKSARWLLDQIQAGTLKTSPELSEDALRTFIRGLAEADEVVRLAEGGK